MEQASSPLAILAKDGHLRVRLEFWSAEELTKIRRLPRKLPRSAKVIVSFAGDKLK